MVDFSAYDAARKQAQQGQTVTGPTTPAAGTTAAPDDSGYTSAWGAGSAGLEQGLIYDPVATAANVGSWLQKHDPTGFVAWANKGPGAITPEAVEAQRQAYEQQYGQNPYAWGGRLVGNMLGAAMIPGVGEVGGLAEAGTAAAARAAPWMAAKVAPWVARTVPAAIKGAAQGGYAGALGGGLASGGYDQTLGQGLVEGGIGGALTGGALPIAGGLLTRKSIDPVLQQYAKDMDVRLSSGDIYGGAAKRVEDIGSFTPFSGSGTFRGLQRQDVTAALSREMGEGNQTHLDSGSMWSALQNIGGRIDNAANKISIPSYDAAGNPTSLLPDIANVGSTFSTPGTGAARNFNTLETELNGRLTAGPGGLTMTGPDFQKMIAKGGNLDRMLKSSDSQTANMASEFYDALINAANNHGIGTADDMKAFQQARYQYAVAKAIQPAVSANAAGSDAMDLNSVRTALERHFGAGMPPPGKGLNDGAAKLTALMRGVAPLRSSGTAERAYWQQLLGGLGEAAAGGGLHALTLGSPLALSGAVTSAVPIAGMGIANRLLQYGPGMGSRLLGSAQQRLNPVMPRLGGSYYTNQFGVSPQDQNQ